VRSQSTLQRLLWGEIKKKNTLYLPVSLKKLKFLQNILRYIIIPEFFENFKSIINRCFRSGGKTWITLYVNVVVFYFEKYIFSDTLETENCLKFSSLTVSVVFLLCDVILSKVDQLICYNASRKYHSLKKLSRSWNKHDDCHQNTFQ
jgi:hypothetical protein